MEDNEPHSFPGAYQTSSRVWVTTESQCCNLWQSTDTVEKENKKRVVADMNCVSSLLNCLPDIKQNCQLIRVKQCLHSNPFVWGRRFNFSLRTLVTSIYEPQLYNRVSPTRGIEWWVRRTDFSTEKTLFCVAVPHESVKLDIFRNWDQQLN